MTTESDQDPAPPPAAPPDVRTMTVVEFAAKAALFEAERRAAAQRRDQAVMAELQRCFPSRTPQ